MVANLEEWVELSNGCLCCSVKSDMVNALEALIQRKRALDYILIETTGRRLAEAVRIPLHGTPCVVEATRRALLSR